MKSRWKCPTSVLLLSDYLPVAPITLLLIKYQRYICVTNWNMSDQYPTKLVGSEKSTFQPASGQPPASVEGGAYVNIIFECVALTLVSTRTTRTPAFWGYPPLPHVYPYHWVILDPKSKEVKVTNLKNSPKFKIFELWNWHYTRHTFSSCLIKFANVKWIR